jgi:hypothetical protein
MEAVGERKLAWWAVLLRLLLVFVLLFGAAMGLMMLLGFPQEVAMIFASVVGIQGSGLAWITAGIRAKVREGLVHARYESHLLRRRGMISMAGFSVVFVIVVIIGLSSIWLQTLFVVGLVLLGLYGGFSILASYLIEWEGSYVSHGFAGRWIGRMTAFLVASTGLVLLLMFNFLGGIQWWYNAYVTGEKRKKVQARDQYLKAVKLTALFDRHKRYMGLYRKTDSDWNRFYNDPDLLKWKVSRAISLSEGRVQKPAWWWRYLPDGDKLRCEPFSIEAFLRVPYYFFKQRRRVGGSTPALQAAKNFLDFGSGRKGKGLLTTVRTKLFAEMPRSYIMCQVFSPREMMAIYQATLWAGRGSHYGMHRMALHFFGVDTPPDLDWNQSVVLAASLPGPGRLNPWYLTSCRKGKCKSKRQAAVYKVWMKRINHLKARLRARGIKIPKELPTFRDGLGKLSAISYKWKHHDLHVRSWIQKRMAKQAPSLTNWDAGAKIRLFYDRALTTGRGDKKGLAALAQKDIEDFRYQLDDLQISFALVDSTNGRMVSMYGGDGNVDMALAKKPVVGSTFKVLTLLVGDQWPDALPFLNKGRTKANRRRFIYHPTPRHPYHYVRNSHAMPAFVNKKEALQISANIGFVFFSLRWTWLVSPLRWLKIMSVGLQQMYRDKLKLSERDAAARVEKLMKDPVELRKELVRHFGFRPYLQKLREQSLFEATKAATIRTLLSDPEVDKKHLTELLSLESGEPLTYLSDKIQQTFKQEQDAITKRFQGTTSLEELSWNRELRMEIGLRYIIYLAGKIAGYNRKDDHLLPVMTMTLGVNDADTTQLASVASFVASATVRPPRMIMTVSKQEQVQYHGQTSILRAAPVSKEAVEQVRQAMQLVLAKGTAAAAGRFLKAKYKADLLSKAGAKTGTVQGSRGVSCVGYLEHRAGAVTLSTPKNDVLRAYRVRRTYTRKLARLERQQKRWYRYFERTRSSSRKRRYLARALKYKRQAQALSKKIESLRAFGKTYYGLRREHKRLQKLAVRFARAGRKERYRAARLGRSIRRYRRYAENQQRRLDRAKQSIEDLGGVKDLSAREKRKLRRVKKRIARYQKRKNVWVKRLQKALASQKKATAKASKYTNASKKWMALGKAKRAKYAGMSRRFYKTHQPWSLSSAMACRILFKLLSHWKDWEEKVEPAPKEEPIPTIQTPAPSTNAPVSVDAGPLARTVPPVPPRMSVDAGTGLPDARNALGEPSVLPERKTERIPEKRRAPDVRIVPEKKPEKRKSLQKVLDALRGKPTLRVRPMKRNAIVLPAPPRIIGEGDKKKP